MSNMVQISSQVAVKDLLKKCDAVCFDVDSTVIRDEGIDILAEFKGAGGAVAAWTQKYINIHTFMMTITFCPRRAMGGQVLFQDALSARLDLIKPSKVGIKLKIGYYNNYFHYID